MDVQEQKKKMRKMIRTKQKALDPEYQKQASKIIFDRVSADPKFSKAHVIFCFAGSPEKGEPDTRPIIEKALKQGKRVCVPLCRDEKNMDAVEITDFERDMTPGFYGILEPEADSSVVDPEEIDLALIPCVTCDKEGHRLGHGRGYYDRYLTKTRCSAVLLCFSRLMTEPGSIPVDTHDLSIERVITDAE